MDTRVHILQIYSIDMYLSGTNGTFYRPTSALYGTMKPNLRALHVRTTHDAK